MGHGPWQRWKNAYRVKVLWQGNDESPAPDLKQTILYARIICMFMCLSVILYHHVCEQSSVYSCGALLWWFESDPRQQQTWSSRACHIWAAMLECCHPAQHVCHVSKPAMCTVQYVRACSIWEIYNLFFGGGRGGVVCGVQVYEPILSNVWSVWLICD